MKKVIVVIIFTILMLILVVSTIIITKSADKEANENLRKNFVISIKKTSGFNVTENISSQHKEGESVCETITQLKLNETFMKSIGCESEETCETEHGVYYTKSFKCIYTFTNNKTSVPNNLPFDRQTCLAMKGLWIEGNC